MLLYIQVQFSGNRALLNTHSDHTHILLFVLRVTDLVVFFSTTKDASWVVVDVIKFGVFSSKLLACNLVRFTSVKLTAAMWNFFFIALLWIQLHLSVT